MNRQTPRYGAILTVIAGLLAAVPGCSERDPGSAGTQKPPATGVSAKNAEAALQAAEDYLQSDQPAKAEAILRELIRKSPSEPRGHEMLGRTLLQGLQGAAPTLDGKRQLAITHEAYGHYRRATELDAESAGLQHSAGVIAMLAEEPQAALAHFEAAARIDPANPQHPLFAAQVLIQLEALDEASNELRRVLTLDPDEPLGHASRAVIAMKQEQFVDALEHIAEARAIAPNDPQFRVQEARILRRSGDPDAALARLIGLSDAERGSFAVSDELAAAYQALERPLDAADVWVNCFRAQPAGRQSHLPAVRAGEAYLAAGRRDQAEWWLNQARLFAPANDPDLSALQRSLTVENEK